MSSLTPGQSYAVTYNVTYYMGTNTSFVYSNTIVFNIFLNYPRIVPGVFYDQTIFMDSNSSTNYSIALDLQYANIFNYSFDWSCPS